MEANRSPSEVELLSHHHKLSEQSEFKHLDHHAPGANTAPVGAMAISSTNEVLLKIVLDVSAAFT